MLDISSVDTSNVGFVGNKCVTPYCGWYLSQGSETKKFNGFGS